MCVLGLRGLVTTKGRSNYVIFNLEKNRGIIWLLSIQALEDLDVLIYLNPDPFIIGLCIIMLQYEGMVAVHNIAYILQGAHLQLFIAVHYLFSGWQYCIA